MPRYTVQPLQKLLAATINSRIRIWENTGGSLVPIERWRRIGHVERTRFATLGSVAAFGIDASVNVVKDPVVDAQMNALDHPHVV